MIFKAIVIRNLGRAIFDSGVKAGQFLVMDLQPIP